MHSGSRASPRDANPTGAPVESDCSTPAASVKGVVHPTPAMERVSARTRARGRMLVPLSTVRALLVESTGERIHHRAFVGPGEQRMVESESTHHLEAIRKKTGCVGRGTERTSGTLTRPEGRGLSQNLRQCVAGVTFAIRSRSEGISSTAFQSLRGSTRQYSCLEKELKPRI